MSTPAITIDSVVQRLDGSKLVDINYTGTDSDNLSNTITQYEYSTDNTNWYTMTFRGQHLSHPIPEITLLLPTVTCNP